MDTYRIYLELLRAGLWDRPACVSEPFDLKAVTELASRQVTLPTICSVILKMPGIALSSKKKEQMQSIVDRCGRSHHAADTVIATVCTVLAAQGINSVLLKGQGIARSYPVPAIRQAGDIDLYVPVKDYPTACTLLTAMFGHSEGKETEKHMGFHVGGTLELELHKFTEVFPDKKLNSTYQRISDQGTSENCHILNIGGADVATPEDNFNAFYIFHHLWGHTSAMGMGMRQLCDWSAFLRSRSGRLDSGKIACWLKEMNLTDVWQVFGCAAVKGLELSPEDVPLYDASKMKRGERLLAYFLGQGENREFKHGRRGQSAARHKAGSLAYMHKRLFRMLPIFPREALKQYFHDLGGGIRKIFKHK